MAFSQYHWNFRKPSSQAMVGKNCAQGFYQWDLKVQEVAFIVFPKFLETGY
jgi:hypothetical protein